MDRGKIKILFAINHLGIGGAEMMMVEQANALDAERFDPYIVSIYRNPVNNIVAKIEVAARRYTPFAFKNIYDIPSWWRLYRYMRKERFDCVLTNLFDANVIVRTLAILTGVRCILSYEHNIYRTRKLWQVTADRLLAPWNYRILVGAPQVKEWVMTREKISAAKIQVIFDAAQLVFEEAKQERAAVLHAMQLQEDALYVVAAGSFTEQKGHAYLIDAWKQVTTHYQHSGKKLMLLIFGRGDLKDALEKRVQQLGLQHDIILPGIAPMKDILAIADIFSIISLWEGFSIALIQAMNAGCPIVATAVSGSVDAITNDVDGLLIAPKDVTAAAEAFIRLLDDSALRQRLGEAAQKSSGRFDIKNQIKEIEALVLDCLKRRER